MIGVCLGLAGVIWAQLPASDFSLAWQHSVEKVRWEEDYRVQHRQLYLEHARVEGSGAGMEVPAQARFEHGRWHYRPGITLDILRLGRTPEAGDYQLCRADAACRWLTGWGRLPPRNPPSSYGCANWVEACSGLPLKPQHPENPRTLAIRRMCHPIQHL